MSYSNFVLRGVEVWQPWGAQKFQDVWVKEGIIHRMGPTGSFSATGSQVVDLEINKLCLVPQGVDAQVHLRVPGQPEKETPESSLRAAFFGGFASVLTMPNTNPVLDAVPALQLAKSMLEPWERFLGVRVLYSAALSLGQHGRTLVDFRALKSAGAVAFTDDGRGLADDHLMDQAFALLAEVDAPLLQHAEVPGHGGVLAPSKVQELLGVKAYPSQIETKMVERDLEFLKRHPRARYHLLHVSTPESVALIQDARRAGLRVSCEVTPHHLLFSSEDIDPKNPSFKMNPPLRDATSREGLRQALKMGAIDFVATDHAPHEPARKMDFQASAFGTTGLEASLRVLLQLRNQGYLDVARLVQVFATGPADAYHFGHLGRFREGLELKAVLLDPGASPSVVSDRDLAGQCKNSCFAGALLPGCLVGRWDGERWTGFRHAPLYGLEEGMASS